MGKQAREAKERRRQWVILASFLLFVLLAGSIAVEFLGAAKTIAVRFENPDGSRSSVFHLEMAVTPQEQEKGLMYRRELEPNGGMIFFYNREIIQSFWMKNTYVSLDLLFIDSKKKVVGILPRVPILNEEPRKVDALSQYVIELAAGTAEREKIVVGSVARW